MADPLNLLSSEALDAAKPVEGLNLLADPNAPGPIKRGFGAAVSGAKAGLYGAKALAANLVGARDTAAAAQEKVAEHEAAAAVQSEGFALSDVDWTSPTSILRQIGYYGGQAAPTMTLMATGAGVGAGAGALAARGVASGAAKSILPKAGAVAGLLTPDIALEAGSIYPEA